QPSRTRRSMRWARTSGNWTLSVFTGLDSIQMPLLRHPARRHVPRLALLLLQRRHFCDALLKHADFLSAAGDFDCIVGVGFFCGLARERAAGVEGTAGRGIRG